MGGQNEKNSHPMTDEVTHALHVYMDKSYMEVSTRDRNFQSGISGFSKELFKVNASSSDFLHDFLHPSPTWSQGRKEDKPALGSSHTLFPLQDGARVP
jgi:hypothetical protein